jgi:alkanesulfonate monooxygenase SsuD/methylene tetrahydromethanopterin reductase-like flavin-dependent oxidoreductase (luciferase family)
VADDAEEAAAAAQEDLLFYLGYPEINPILDHAGVMEEAEAIRRAHREHGKAAALQLITPRMLDHLAIYGSTERCRARLREVIEAGLDVPIIRVSSVPYAETEKKPVFLRAIESLRDF